MDLMTKEIINTSDEFLFDLTQNYDKRNHWDKLMGTVTILTPPPITKGSELLYKTYIGIKMTVRYRAYHPPKNASIEMISPSFWLKQFSGVVGVLTKLMNTRRKLCLPIVLMLKDFPKSLIQFLSAGLSAKINAES